MSRNIIVILVFVFLASCGQNNQSAFVLEDEAQKWNSSDKIWVEADLKVLFEGEQLYHRTCSVCHGRAGTGDLQIGAVALKGRAGRMPVETLVTRVLRGKKNSMMPAFSASLSDRELSSIASYVRNAWGNNSGRLVQPSAVASLR